MKAIRHDWRTARLAIGLALLCAAMVAGLVAPAQAAPGDGLTIYLVRHAEKAKDSDPGLTSLGRKRSRALAQRLAAAGIRKVHTTDYRRTRQTAAPTAIQNGLQLSIYNPRHLSRFARALKAADGAHLVVGHSNTTPELVRLLGGDAGPPINEGDEFDRLYVLTIDAGGRVSTQRTRYGP